MDFDFYQHYKDYSTVDLLKIIEDSDDYQPAAVDAVQQLLSEREVTESAKEEAKQYFQQRENKAKQKQEKINAYKEKATDFLQPVLNPGPAVGPEKWLNILLLFIGIQYLWTFYKGIKHLLSFSRCSYCRFDIFEIVNLINLLYIPVIFYLLLKRRRWGWILLFADNMLAFFFGLGNLYIFLKYWEYAQGDTSFIVNLLIRVIFIFFLWRKPIADLFGVSENTKKDTLIVSCLLALLIMGLFMFSVL